jgi:hypothetical protein
MPDAADLTNVIALARKGRELSLKGHSARAAEKYSRAAEEAERALLFPDCLVTCVLRHEQLHALLRHATASVAEPADADHALREAFVRLLPSVMAVLERRKAAGTLLPGNCRPIEEAYHVATKRHNMELEGCTRAFAAERSAVLARYVGLATYIHVASSVVYTLTYIDSPLLKRAFVLSDEQKHAAYLFVARALDLMARPRNFDSWMTGEPGLVEELRKLIPAVSDVDEPATKKLCAAWRRVLRSGVLRERGIDKGIDATDQQHQRICAAAAADLAAGRLQQCALAGCAACESHASHFKRCGACRTVCYCCREHQVEDWPSHKAACKAARKAAAEDADAA